MDDDEEYDEAGGTGRFLGFLFGNVDNCGDLDVDYLDEDAKEHLDALADQLGPSFSGIHLSLESSKTSADVAERDYNDKAEDAVDYEDIDEDYDGPEIQDAGEEEYLLPKKEFFSADVSLAALRPTTSVFDDENYDEDEEDKEEEEPVTMEDRPGVATSLSGPNVTVVSEGEKSAQDVAQRTLDDGTSNFELEDSHVVGEQDLKEPELKGSAPLPILCVEDGMVILKFSEIFGIHEPLKNVPKREHKYAICKEQNEPMDISDIVEDDEEAFLRGSNQVTSSCPHDISTCYVEDSRLSNGEEVFHMSGPTKEPGKDICLSGEPMSDDLTANLSVGWKSQCSSTFFLLDQHDWEDRILWDDYPAASESSLDFSDIPIHDSGADEGTGNLRSESLLQFSENEHNLPSHSSHVLLESFRSEESLDLSCSSSGEKCHPQLLRLESLLDKSNDVNRKKENKEMEISQSGTSRRFSELSLQNRYILEGSWLDNIIWDQEKANVKPKLILDLQDEQMLFEILDDKESKKLQLHAGAMIITRSSKSRSSIQEFSDQRYQSCWQFNISNDKFYTNKKISQQLQPNSSKRIPYGIKVHHSAPAIKLQTFKMKLINKDLANFHRPKSLWFPHDNEVAVKHQGKLATAGPMIVILKSLGGKVTKLHVDAEETLSSVKSKASKKLDFKPSEEVRVFYAGKDLEDQISLAAQNVRPNSLLHLVRTKIHLLPKAQRIPGVNKSLRPPGAFKKKSELSVKDGHVILMEYFEERPLLLSNVGMGANLRTYYQKTSPSDQGGSLLRNRDDCWGNVVTLDPNDKSPFLGDIKPGCCQSSLETNMYKAPIFPHKVSSTDYLLVRSAKGKLSLRRIDRVAVVGQEEPIMEVFSPASKNLQAYALNRLLVHVYREFRAAEKGGLIQWIRADELTAQFPGVADTILRKKMKECAVLRRDAHGDLYWSKKRDFIIPSEEELKKMVTPENVCAYESMQAGLYRLKHSGISRLTFPTQLPDVSSPITLAATTHIERELQITPWSLSSNFVTCTNQDRENIERLEITGVGDPSGRGLGFSYVRATPKGAVSNAMVKKKAAAGRGGSSVTGTDADLRRLSMEAAREVLLKFNVPDEQITKLTRWHRIALIRKLSSEQAASGVKVDPTTISKYARGQRMSFLQLQQQTREKCQEIWDKQVQAFSAVDGDENDSDSEAISDLDSFASDLENLLDAEECEGVESNYESKRDKGDGVKGLKMRRHPSQTQAEEENEDEAVEAAELCRLLMDAACAADGEAEQKKKKKTKGAGLEAVLATGSKLNVIDSVEQVKKAFKLQPIELHVLNEKGGEIKEVESLFGKKKVPDKLKSIKKIDIPSLPQIKAKVIMGDGLKASEFPMLYRYFLLTSWMGFKEKKSSRESFVCGACGQLGHMRTNKNCPRYREEPETPVESVDVENNPGKLISGDPSTKAQQKIQKKKVVPKTGLRNDVQQLPVKFKCGSTEVPFEKPTVEASLSSDQNINVSALPVSSDTDTGNKSITKIKIASKGRPEVASAEVHRPFQIQQHSVDTDRGVKESYRPPVTIKPPVNVEKERLETRKTILIRPPADREKDLSRRKVVIRQPREVWDMDQTSQDGSSGFEYQKTKKIVELSSFEKQRKLETLHFTGGSAKKKSKEEVRWLEEEEKRRNLERLREERRMRAEETRRQIKEREFREYEETMRRGREEEEEEEERQRAKKRKRKEKPEISDEYMEDYKARRNDKRMHERGFKRQPTGELGKYSAKYAPPTKRRRGGEVLLSNALEGIVDTLRERRELSYLFLKPVSKKEAPDYLKIIERPMDLSTIKEKVRKMEYKSREEFRRDVWQITFNAHKYNDRRNPGIPPLADQLLEICDFLLHDKAPELDEAEAAVGI
ncbi:Transcription initiation factor TFIID subunit 1 [Linum grandiflorum]